MELLLGGVRLKVRVERLRFETGVEYTASELEEKNGVFKAPNCSRVALRAMPLGGSAAALYVEARSPATAFSSSPLTLKVGVDEALGPVLGLTFYNLAVEYEKGFEYYDLLARDRKPSTPRPPDEIPYPAEPRGRALAISCWTFPYTARGVDGVYPYTAFLLAQRGDGYLALAALSSGDVSSSIGRGLSVSVDTGVPSSSFSGWFLAASHSNDPYRAVEEVMKALARATNTGLRTEKPVPRVISKLGWCSWNALQLDDLSHESVTRIVRGLIERRVPVRWVIVDDGWQIEESHPVEERHWRSGVISVRIIREPRPRSDRFPKGFEALVRELKEAGVEEVGLWHTINAHWAGGYAGFFEELGAPYVPDANTGAFAPSPRLEEAERFFDSLLRLFRTWGFDFVKTDNQWYVRFAYPYEPRGRSASSLELALQLAAGHYGMWILNSMAMTPECYSNFLLSNVTRVSLDYIPMWRGGARLHTMWNVYNALFFSHITYPDYDMWMSYDPCAELYAVAAVLSGGPIYLTDRQPEKANVELIRRIALPSGEVVRVDAPGVPTRDLLFEDPYNNPVPLKVASTVHGIPVVAILNVYRGDKPVKGVVRLGDIPRLPTADEYAYYLVSRGSRGVVRRGEELEVEVEPCRGDVLVLSPIQGGVAVIGIKEYLLPPYPVEVLRSEGGVVVRSAVDGTLLVYRRGAFEEIRVSAGSTITIAPS